MKIATSEEHWRKVVVGLLAVVTVILAGAALRATYVVTMPLAVAIFLAILVQPIQIALARRMPDKLRWLGVAAAMLVILAVLGVFVGAFWYSVELVAEKAPQYADKFEQVWQQGKDWAEAHHLPVEEEFLDVEKMRSELMRMAGVGLKTVLGVLSALVLIFFLILLFLLESHEWKDKSAAAFRAGRRRHIVEVVRVAGEKVRQYLYVQTMVSAISGVLGGGWLWLVGVDFAFMWGFMIFLLNYLPNIGSIIAIFPPAILAFVQFGWGRALLAVAGYTVIEQVIGNFLQPRMQGRRLTISPAVVLVALVFWGWVWGIPGAILAVPIMTTIMVICAHTQALKPLAQLLGRSGDPEEMEKLNNGGTTEGGD